MKRKMTGFSIRTKTTVFVVAAVGVLVTLVIGVQFRTSLNRVEHIENDQAAERADRISRQLENSLADIGGTNADWAWWDDSLEFVQDGNQAFEDDNLYADAFTPIGVDVIVYVDADGATVHGDRFVDGDSVAVPEPLLELVQPGALLGDFDDDAKATPSGIVRADDDVFLVTSRAILPSDESGEASAGVLLMAREMNAEFTEELARLVNLDLVVEPCGSQNCAGLDESSRISTTSDVVTSETAISSVDGTPVLLAQVNAPRTMYQESLDGLLRVLFILSAVGIVAVAITVAGLRRLIVVPLERLGSTVADVARTNNPSLRAPVDRHDEIGALAGEVNVMLARLENAQQQLIAAKERVEGASEAKSRFLSRVSHELRTPINGVLAYAQLLQLDHPDGESRESIDQIVTSARHITNLVDEFLDIARIEAGAIPMNIDAIDVMTVASEVVNMTEPLASAQGATVSLSGDEGASVMADPLRLRQAVLNLVSNAIKYGQGDEPIVIDVSIDGPQVAIEVRDHGPGIPEVQLERLFVPFDRLDADATAHEGSGVGLSVTKQLVELMNGTVDVTSEVGAGAAFTINLPGCPTPAPAHVEQSESVDTGV